MNLEVVCFLFYCFFIERGTEEVFHMVGGHSIWCETEMCMSVLWGGSNSAAYGFSLDKGNSTSLNKNRINQANELALV